MVKLKDMTDTKLVEYFAKLIETGLTIESRERRETKEEILNRLETTVYEVKEKGIIVDQPVNMLLFTNDELLVILKCLHLGLSNSLLGEEMPSYEEIQNTFEKVSGIQKIMYEKLYGGNDDEEEG